jgi:hypothetical protein
MPLNVGAKLGPYVSKPPSEQAASARCIGPPTPNLAREVAIKVLPESVASDAEQLAHFDRDVSDSRRVVPGLLLRVTKRDTPGPHCAGRAVPHARELARAHRGSPAAAGGTGAELAAGAQLARADEGRPVIYRTLGSTTGLPVAGSWENGYANCRRYPFGKR